MPSPLVPRRGFSLPSALGLSSPHIGITFQRNSDGQNGYPWTTYSLLLLWWVNGSALELLSPYSEEAIVRGGVGRSDLISSTSAGFLMFWFNQKPPASMNAFIVQTGEVYASLCMDRHTHPHITHS